MYVGPHSLGLTSRTPTKNSFVLGKGPDWREITLALEQYLFSICGFGLNVEQMLQFDLH
jgi:hypothetical protein